MEALIEWITRNLMALWPLCRIYSWQIGLRIRNGIVREELGPGIHWRWWFVDQVDRCPNTTTLLDLRFGSITTKDSKSICLSANIGYRVTSIRTLRLAIDDPDESIHAFALGKLCSLSAGKTWPELLSSRKRIETWLARETTKAASPWGVEITHVFLTDFVEARQLRLLADGNAAAVVDDEAA